MLNYVLHGLLHLSFWGYVVTTLILMHVTVIFNLTIFYIVLNPIALQVTSRCKSFFSVLVINNCRQNQRMGEAQFTASITLMFETAEDPHSPKIFGLRKVFFEGAELYQEEAKDPETISRRSRNAR